MGAIIQYFAHTSTRRHHPLLSRAGRGITRAAGTPPPGGGGDLPGRAPASSAPWACGPSSTLGLFKCREALVSLNHFSCWWLHSTTLPAVCPPPSLPPLPGQLAGFRQPPPTCSRLQARDKPLCCSAMPGCGGTVEGCEPGRGAPAENKQLFMSKEESYRGFSGAKPKKTHATQYSSARVSAKTAPHHLPPRPHGCRRHCHRPLSPPCRLSRLGSRTSYDLTNGRSRQLGRAIRWGALQQSPA